METLWLGNANAWECDELGHLNVRAYLAKAMAAAGALAERLGMPYAFSSRATATLLMREAHLRYHAEVLPGAPLAIEGGIEAACDETLDAVFVMKNAASGATAATIRVKFDHVAPKTARRFPFATRTREALTRLRVETPEAARPRGIADRPGVAFDLADAERLGLERSGLGRIGPEDCDLFGRMRAEMAIGKVSDSVVHFSRGLPEQWRDHAGHGRPERASAVLEMRVIMRRYPRAGAGFDLRSGLTSADAKVRGLVHWACDPRTGEALWSMEGVACMLDLQTRRLAPADPDTLAALEAAVVEGLQA